MGSANGKENIRAVNQDFNTSWESGIYERKLLFMWLEGALLSTTCHFQKSAMCIDPRIIESECLMWALQIREKTQYSILRILRIEYYSKNS